MINATHGIFASDYEIPGLDTFLDFGTQVSGDGVSSTLLVTDQSGNGNNFSSAQISGSPKLVTRNGYPALYNAISTSGIRLSSINKKAHFAFLTNGTPNAVYVLAESLAGSSLNYRLYGNGFSPSLPRNWITIPTTGANANHILRNASSQDVANVTATVSDGVHGKTILYRAIWDGAQVKIKVAGITTSFTPVNAFSQTVSDCEFALFNGRGEGVSYGGTEGHSFAGWQYASLIYNWSDYTPSQIAELDAQTELFIKQKYPLLTIL